MKRKCIIGFSLNLDILVNCYGDISNNVPKMKIFLA